MNPSTRSGLRFGPIDFTQPSTWRGIAGIIATLGFGISPELTHVISIALGAALSAIEILRNENAVDPKRKLKNLAMGEPWRWPSKSVNDATATDDLPPTPRI